MFASLAPFFHSHTFITILFILPLFCFVLGFSSRLCHQVVSYPPSYKKTPPPVPPRATTKPLISVTAQSSTESTQDAYQEGRHPRGGLWTTDSLGRPIYSSMDSLDSTKAVTMVMETAASKRHASLGSHTSVQTCDKAVLVSKAEEYLKTPRSSIGIQVRQWLRSKHLEVTCVFARWCWISELSFWFFFSFGCPFLKFIRVEINSGSSFLLNVSVSFYLCLHLSSRKWQFSYWYFSGGTCNRHREWK